MVSCAFRLPPAVSGSGVRCGRACWARVSAVPRPSWLGCRGVFLALFFFGFAVSVVGCPCPGPCGLSPYPLSFGLGCWLFFLSWCVSACFGAPFPGGPMFLAWCCRFWLGGPPVPLWGSCLRCLLGGGFGRLLCCWRAVWWLWAVFAPPPPCFLFFFPGGGLPVPPSAFRWAGARTVAGVWCGWSLATPGGGSCVLLPATPGWVSLPVVVGTPRHSWLRVPGAVPRHSWLGSAGGGGVWCAGGGVLVGLWLVCGVLGPSPLLAEVPVCYSPPLLAGFRCRWWWAFLATPGGGSGARFPATPGWVSLSAVVCGVWCVVCGVRRWCVGGVVAGVWCGWSLATPGGGSCVLLPATPRWVALPVVVRGPRHSWLRVPGAVPRHSWLGCVGGGGVWCVVCGAGVLVGLWLVCGVVGPSPLLAEVPVCYPPPLLAGFRCRWWWAFLATPR